MSYYDSYAQRNVSSIGKYLGRKLACFIESQIDRWCEPGGSVLEIGSGDGRFAQLISTKYKYTGIEPSEALAKRLQESGITVRKTFVPPILEDDQSQNAIIASHILEHMPDHKKAYELCQEIYRICKPGGIAFILCPDARQMGMLFYDVDYSHGYITTPARVYQLLRDCGFTIKSKGILFGAIGVFPGLIFSSIIKLFFWFSGLVLNHASNERKGFLKLENLFSQAFWVVAQRPLLSAPPVPEK
jgi:SAM-dependent methyltransferase